MLKKVMLIFLMTICVVNVNYAKGEKTYLCIAYKATGFLFDSKTKDWKNSNFNVENQKKIVEKINGSWYWHEFNNKYYQPCKEAILGTITCTLLKYPLFTFKFNIETMRYVYSYVGAYDDGDSDASPYIEIGTCTPINLK